VLTISGLDHHKAFRTRANVAAELATLARGTPASGIVLANADDEELIRAIAGALPRVVTFGAAAAADYRVANVTVGSDLTLSCTCLHGDSAIPLVTRLVGRHQHVAVLAAVAAAHLRGVPWHTIAERVASFEPVFGRCSRIVVRGGATFICDTAKAPAWSCETSLAILDDCPSAPRRTLVFGTLSDYAGDSRRAYRRLLQQARGRTDRVVFLRQTPSHVGATAEEQAAGRVLFFADVAAIADHLGRTALPGEVILVKGSMRADHLERVALAAVAPVACRAARCGRGRPCVECDLLGDGTRAGWWAPGIRRLAG
jgi:UDP-N-acetylmuramoyl-tripeptide--D-alanyl-D-alanine ligase